MTVKQLIDMSCAYAGISKADLARNAGWSPQTLSNRINTGKFSMEDWEKLGKAMGWWNSPTESASSDPGSLFILWPQVGHPRCGFFLWIGC